MHFMMSLLFSQLERGRSYTKAGQTMQERGLRPRKVGTVALMRGPNHCKDSAATFPHHHSKTKTRESYDIQTHQHIQKAFISQCLGLEKRGNVTLDSQNGALEVIQYLTLSNLVLEHQSHFILEKEAKNVLLWLTSGSTKPLLPSGNRLEGGSMCQVNHPLFLFGIGVSGGYIPIASIL